MLLAAVVLQSLPQPTVHAAAIYNRSMTLIAGALDGGSKSGGTVTHKFDFTVPAGGNVSSIKFEYCTTAADVGAATCVAPTGLSASGATLGAESGITGVTMNASAGSFYLSRASAFNLAANTTVSYTINGVVNPIYGPTVPDTNKTFFVRISAYSTTNATGVPIHKGTVAASTAEPIILDGTMPESLVFCTGATVGLTASVPDCSTATSGVIHFNQLFSPITTATATSQMAASTNAGSGYVISVNGPTLTSGSNTITAMNGTPNTAYASNHGVSQFGMNLRLNSDAITGTTGVTLGGEVAPLPTGPSNYKGQAVPSSGYDTIDQFRFQSGEVVANSAFGGSGQGTDAQIYTVSYIANVTGSLPAGSYVTTLTYICTPTF